MAGNGKKKTEAQRAADAAAAAPPEARLGTAGNPIQGPALQDFTRGPEVNYTIPTHRVDAGEPQIGTQANPIQGPALGSSPGVQNPGDLTIKGPATPQAIEDATALSDDQRTMHNMRMRTAHSTSSAAGENTPGTLLGKDDKGNQTNTTIVPRAGETAEDAARRVMRDGGDNEPLAEETALTQVQSKHSAEIAKLNEKHTEARSKLGEKHAEATAARQEDGAKLADQHREELEKDGSNDTITRHSTERQAFDNESTELTTKQSEEFQQLQAEQQQEVTELQAKQAQELKEAQTAVSDAQEKKRVEEQKGDGPTHRRGGNKHTNGHKAK